MQAIILSNRQLLYVRLTNMIYHKYAGTAYSKNTSITARGSGTGLLGQSLNDNIIVDFTKHMNKILEVGTDHSWLQPGLVKGILDKELKKRGKFLPADPASSNYCQLAV